MNHMTSREIGAGLPQPISDEDIATVLSDKDLAEAFREKYILTLNLDHRYQVIVHAIALSAYENGIDAGLRLRDLTELCRQYWPAGFADLPIDFLRGLVIECCDLGLLTEDAGRYRMRTPYVLRLLGSVDEVTEVLFNAEERLTLPSSLDAGSYRDRIGTGMGRSPLTARQVGRLFETEGRTHVIVGSEALSAGRVMTYLEQYATQGRANGYAVRKVANVTPVGLAGQARRVTRPTMLVVDMRTGSPTQVAEILEEAPHAHEVAAADLILTVIAATNSAVTWLSASESLVELTRVDMAGLRLWCEEADSTFDAPDMLVELATATGGWPTLVERVLSQDRSGVPTSARRSLADLTAKLATAQGARDLVNACGLGDACQSPVTAVLAAVFCRVAEWTGEAPATLSDLVYLLSDSDEQPLMGQVERAGFGGVADVLQVLQLAGMVTMESSLDGQINVRVEPVLARAVEVVGRARGAEVR